MRKLTPASAGSIVTRRIVGPLATDVAVLCRPDGSAASTAAQAEHAYHELLDALIANGATAAHLDREVLFVRDIGRDLPAILESRRRVLATRSPQHATLAPTYIQQAPAPLKPAFELLAMANVAEGRAPRDLAVATPACPCAACAQAMVRIGRVGSRVTAYATNLYGAGSDAFEQALNAFRTADGLLQQCGLQFTDVVRTWIYLRDIDRDYAALNRARHEFFASRGIVRRPASTGVQGGPFPASHDVAIGFLAMQDPQVEVMSCPSLNEAWSYGADFSRGFKITHANGATLHVSGTASIDETGRSIHAGNLAAQTDRMLHNIAQLLERYGAGVGDVLSGITYLKYAADGPTVQAIMRERGFADFPCALVEAPLCRPELLCETECVALLSITPAGGA